MSSKLLKVKKSFSISPESNRFIQRMRRERKTKSESDTLDALLSELMTMQKLKEIENSYTNYYDELPEADVDEQNQWASIVGPTLVEMES